MSRSKKNTKENAPTEDVVEEVSAEETKVTETPEGIDVVEEVSAEETKVVNDAPEGTPETEEEAPALTPTNKELPKPSAPKTTAPTGKGGLGETLSFVVLKSRILDKKSRRHSTAKVVQDFLLTSHYPSYRFYSKSSYDKFVDYFKKTKIETILKDYGFRGQKVAGSRITEGLKILERANPSFA